MSSKYYEELNDTKAKERYASKISVISGVDPYSLKKNDLKKYVADLPDVSYFNVVNYLVYGQSFYTEKDFMCYKSLEAYKQFACNWVREVHSLKIGDFHLVIGKVLHSQAINEKPLQPWLIIEQIGSVKSAHCTCMAGLGEACSHIGALLFYVEYHVRNTVTSVPAYWMDPGIKSAQYAEVKNIDFSTPAKILQNKNESSGSNHACEPCYPLLPKHNDPLVPKLTDVEFSETLRRLHEAGADSAILNLVRPFNENRESNESKSLFLAKLYQEDFLKKSLKDIQHLAENVVLDISHAEAMSVEENTKLQSKSKLWFKYRAGRITASNMKAALATKLEAPSISVIKSICYPARKMINSKAITWGCKHENEARKKYIRVAAKKHDNLIYEKSGFIINPDFPHLGASPDGLISCNCCGDGCLEIKCPYCLKDSTDNLLSHSCLTEENNEVVLLKKHSYFYQVQMQLFLSKRKYCDFVLWNQSDIQIIRVKPDNEFWMSHSEKLQLFFKKVILPELMGKVFTRPSGRNEECIKRPNLIYL